MHPEIEKRFEALEERRRAIVARVRALPKEKQDARPDPKSFSPTELVMHFALAEGFNVGQMAKNPPESLADRRPRVTFLFRKARRDMANPRKPVPTAPFMIPKGEVNLDEAEQKWAEVRTKMRDYLGRVKSPADPLFKMIFLFGMPSADDYLGFLEAHHTYHEVRFPEPC